MAALYDIRFMRTEASYISVFFVLCFTFLFAFNSFSINISKDSVPTISSNTIEAAVIPISITKREFPGLNLDDFVNSKFVEGDNMSFSTR